jgi:hypothetical protein
MRASVLTGEGNVVASNEFGVLTVCEHLFDNMKEFFEKPFESDWEKKTGLPWMEWGKRPVR